MRESHHPKLSEDVPLVPAGKQAPKNSFSKSTNYALAGNPDPAEVLQSDQREDHALVGKHFSFLDT